ncbi:hypothetical protein Hypma_000663 [Hypsizygus marmoreus]|uniref:Uncharacterized protein n=1 Tax=Hypsizygus marmoreus TaxID=39966 RepID=A0A369JCD2_HYPMA|nr:hypothetical protein Hypma_000663 [Hypsizygus marmoreus]
MRTPSTTSTAPPRPPTYIPAPTDTDRRQSPPPGPQRPPTHIPRAPNDTIDADRHLPNKDTPLDTPGLVLRIFEWGNF